MGTTNTKTFRDAACVVLVRGHGTALEVFWVRRSESVPFQPGFMAFPGGKVDEADTLFDVPGVTDAFERAARVCAVREALEETGLVVELERYLVDAQARFRNRGRELEWRTHVVLARTRGEKLAPGDPAEIAAARWGTAAELAGPLRERLLATGRAFWRYRVELHDAALAELQSLRTRTAVP